MVIIIILVLSGCTKPECKTSADCIAKTCFLSKCEGKKCEYLKQNNCCGDGVKDSIENGKQGNQCTCSQDYGKCEGKAKIAIGSRTEDATYMHYYCNADNECVLGVEKKDIAPQNFLDLINVESFKASLIAKYSKPFDTSRDNFEFKITLDDIRKDLVLPLRFTKVKLLFSSQNARTELLIAEKSLDNVLNGIGDETIIYLPLTLSYRPQEIEEAGSLRYSIDYIYIKQVLSGKTVNGTNIYSNETTRATFTAPVKPVLFVRSE